LGQFSTGCG